MDEPTVRSAAFDQLTPLVLHGILKLRADVFVVEQDCVYPDIDGRDVEDDARHYWVEEDGAVVACLRRLRERDGQVRVGRIATRQDARRRGLAAALVDAALADVDVPVLLDAQQHLEAWYEQLGFRRAGEPFVEDGIPHVPMRREPGAG